jgi:hypothetical protein
MKEGCASSVHERHLERLVAENKPMNKLDTADPRLIPGAKVLRALGIDELPQLLNVVRGDMSVIGPRPCIPYEAQQYQPWQRERFAGLPGLTGLWQVRGKNKTTFTEMIRLDIEYVRRQSFWLDLQILLATPKALFGQLAGAIWNRTRPARNHRLSTPDAVPMTTTTVRALSDNPRRTDLRRDLCNQTQLPCRPRSTLASSGVVIGVRT